jgi:ankyrin repeat protein
MGSGSSSIFVESFEAIRTGNETRLKRLVRRAPKALMAYRNIEGLHLISIGCSLGRYSAVKILVHYGQDLNVVDGYGLSPLHHAVNSGHQNIVKYLLGNFAFY